MPDIPRVTSTGKLIRGVEATRNMDFPYPPEDIPQEASALIEMLGYGGALYTDNGTRWSKGRLLAEATDAINSAVERETSTLRDKVYKLESFREDNMVLSNRAIREYAAALAKKDAEIERLKDNLSFNGTRTPYFKELF